MFDAPNWSDIYKQHSKKMLGVCKRYVNDISLAEDLMHEGFIVAMEKQNSFSGFGSFEGWLRMIMVNNALMYLRKNKNKHFISDIEISDTITSNNNTEPAFDMKSKITNTDFSQDELLEVIETIPEHHKMVFNMYVIDKFSHIEISKTLDINVNTSKSHLLRARKRIQELLYAKASEKTEKKDRKKLFFWLFFSSNYIDRIYANGLSEFEVKPSKTFDIENYIKQNNLSEKISNGYFLGLTLQNTLLLVTTLIAGFLFLFYFLKNDNLTTVLQPVKVDSKIISDSKSTENQLDIKLKSNKNLEILNPKKVTSEVDCQKLIKNKNEEVSKEKQQKSDVKRQIALEKKKQNDKKPVVIKKIIDTIYVYK